MMKKIKHLFDRAGFGLSIEEWQKYQNQPLQVALNDLFEQGDKAPFPFTPSLFKERPDLMNPTQRKELQDQERENLRQVIEDWVSRMASTEHNALLERMSLFWHGHFACTSRLGSLATNQLNVIREHALGDFRSLVVGMAQDPSMIRFLNNQQNRKKQPNENFARELLELFTIGRGHYSEQDIKEAARAFTGWSSDFSGKYVFRPFFHDNAPKTFFGKTGNYDGTDIIDLILEKKATSFFITTKIYKYFVNEQVNPDHVEYLSTVFYDSNYNIETLMRRIFESDWFYASEHIGAKIKSPLDLVAGMMRSLNVKFNDQKSLMIALKTLGQIPFNPPNVAGWPGGKTWIDNATLMMRLNMPFFLMNEAEVNIRPKGDLKQKQRNNRFKKMTATLDLEPIEEYTAGLSHTEIQSFVQSWLLPLTPNQEEIFFDRVSERMQAHTYTQSMIALTMALPEFQLS